MVVRGTVLDHDHVKADASGDCGQRAVEERGGPEADVADRALDEVPGRGSGDLGQGRSRPCPARVGGLQEPLPVLPRRRVVPAQLRDEPGAQEVLVVLAGEPGPLSGGGAVDPGSLVGCEGGQRCSTEDMAQRAGVQVPRQDVQRIHPQGLFVPQPGAGEPVRRVITELTDRHGAYG